MMPQSFHPLLAQKAEAPFNSEQHLFEIKWDGIRCLGFVDGSRVRLQSRRLTEITFQFPKVASLAQLPSGMVLDGELAVLKEGKPSLPHIQQRALLQNSRRHPAFGPKHEMADPGSSGFGERYSRRLFPGCASGRAVASVLLVYSGERRFFEVRISFNATGSRSVKEGGCCLRRRPKTLWKYGESAANIRTNNWIC
jgi:ATP dependent DNA ligase domain